MLVAGIDVGAELHHVAVVDEAETVVVKATSFAEDAAGYQRLFELLERAGARGTLVAQISGVTVAAPFTIVVGANTCSGQSIGPKGTCSFEVEFAPTSVGDVTDGSMNVGYNGTSPAVALEGTGVSKK